MAVPPLTSFQEGPHQNGSFKNFFPSKFCKQDGKKDYSRYCQVAIFINLWQTLSNSFLSLNYGVRASEEEMKLEVFILGGQKFERRDGGEARGNEEWEKREN